MASKTGYIYAGSTVSSGYTFASPRHTNISLGSGEYPKGSISLSGGTWYLDAGSASTTYTFTVYLCDSDGNNTAQIGTISIKGVTQTLGITVSGSVDKSALSGKQLYLKITGNNAAYLKLMNTMTVNVTTVTSSYTISKSVTPSGGGTITVSKTSAAPGTTITMTKTPATGYKFKKWLSSVSGVTFSGDSFVMPAANITVTAQFEKRDYTITTKADPEGAATVTAKKGSSTVTTAQMNDTIELVRSNVAAGHVFDRWTTSPSTTISNADTFLMPAKNITVTAKYKRRSTATLSKNSFTGDDSATLTIDAQKSTYTHRYKISFGTNMETDWITLAAGVTTATVESDEDWSAYIPNAESANGTLTLQTYDGSTQVSGDYVISGLTFHVPDTAVPEITGPTLSRALTIGGITYGSIGNYYVQNHCGVRVQAEADGALGSTVASMSVTISGYSGSDYTETAADDEVDWTSGLLFIAGTLTVTVTAADSRGRTASATAELVVQAYTAPAGSLKVKRVDALRADDDMGEYGTYELTKQYTQLTGNTLTWSLSYSGGTATSPADTGDILPNSRNVLQATSEYVFTLTLADNLETVTVTATLPSADFIIYVDSSGNRLGFFQKAQRTLPTATGKGHTLEISSDTEVYIGNQTLAEYILSIVQ